MSTAPLDDQRSNDAALVAQIRAGDRCAFLHLYETTYPTLLRFAYSIARSRSSAEDAVQNAFVRIWLQRYQWQPNSLIMPYLYRAVRNYVLDHMRHAHVIEQAELHADVDEPYGMGVQPISADTEVERRDRAHAVAAAIRRLPERQRTAIMLRWYDDMTTASIADVMDISRQAAEKLLRSAETRLRTILRRLDTP